MNFDYDNLKQLNLEIFYHKGQVRYAKILTVTFHLTGKKHSIVVSGSCAHAWIDFEVPVLLLKDQQKRGCSYKILKKSNKKKFMLVW